MRYWIIRGDFVTRTYYAKQFGEDGEITSLHSFTASKFPKGNPLFVEMTEDEYIALREEWAANAPEEEPIDSDEASAEEALDIIMNGVVE